MSILLWAVVACILFLLAIVAAFLARENCCATTVAVASRTSDRVSKLSEIRSGRPLEETLEMGGMGADDRVQLSLPPAARSLRSQHSSFFRLREEEVAPGNEEVAPVNDTQEETFAFMQRTWRERGTKEDLLYADSQEWRFKQMRRISEAHETTSHGSWTSNGQPARYLLHSDVWKEGNSIIHWHLKKTKNGGSLVREISCENAALFKHFTERFEQNEVWLSEHPSYRRESLPFFHLEGKAVHRRTIAMVSLEMMELAYETEPGVGHLNPKKYRFNTHSDRKGGAVCMLSNVSQIEAYVRFLGDWKSLSFFDYARTTRKSSVLASRSVGAAFAEIFA